MIRGPWNLQTVIEKNLAGRGLAPGATHSPAFGKRGPKTWDSSATEGTSPPRGDRHVRESAPQGTPSLLFTTEAAPACRDPASGSCGTSECPRNPFQKRFHRSA